jgi:Mrp family chromosome partitioning ATPase
LFGLLAGLGLISWRRRFDDRLRWIDQIEAELALPILAAFPGMSRRWIRRGARVAYRRRRVARQAADAAAVLSILARAFGYRRLLMTGVRGGEETMAAALLALGLADCNERVTLIDAQLSLSSAARHIPETRERSLQSALAGSPALLPNGNAAAALTVLPAACDGAHGSSSLLCGQSFADLVTDAVERCDLVLVQGPCILESADVAALVNQTDASVLIIRAGTTRVWEAKRAASLLGKLGSPIAGIVVVGATGDRRSTQGWPGGSADASIADAGRSAPPPRTNAEPDSAGAPMPHECRRIPS